MAMNKNLGQIKREVLKKKGDQKIRPSGDLTLKNVVNKGKRNSKYPAVVAYGSGSLSGSNNDYPGSSTNAESGSSFSVPTEFITSNRSWLCNEDDSGKVQEWNETSGPDGDPLPIPPVCAQIGLGINRYRVDLSKQKGSVRRTLTKWLDIIPQWCEPIGVMCNIIHPFSGSGTGQEPGNVWIERVGIQMVESGEVHHCGMTWEEQRTQPAYSSVERTTPAAVPICSGTIHSDAPLGVKGEVRPRYYVDRAYFYGSASQASCCNLPLGSTGKQREYAYFAANQGGSGIFSPVRYDGMFYTGYDETPIPNWSGPSVDGTSATFNSKYAIRGCHNGVDELVASPSGGYGSGMTGSYINNTNWPMNKLLVYFNHNSLDMPCSGVMDICFYYRRVVGGYDNSTDFYYSTPCVTGSGYDYGAARGIPEKCVSGSVIACLS